MLLKDCFIGEIVEVMDHTNDDLRSKSMSGWTGHHYVGHIVGLSHNEFEVIPIVQLADGTTRSIHHSNLQVLK